MYPNARRPLNLLYGLQFDHRDRIDKQEKQPRTLLVETEIPVARFSPSELGKYIVKG